MNDSVFFSVFQVDCDREGFVWLLSLLLRYVFLASHNLSPLFIAKIYECAYSY